MNFTTPFRNQELIRTLLSQINKLKLRPIKIMEVCGGHTMAIRKHGLHQLLPSEIELLSGPGCPVCVTEQTFVDKAIAYAQLPKTTLLTYGDLVRVPGCYQSLSEARSAGASVEVIYSTQQALSLARKQPNHRFVFAAIGFETTAPGTALALQQASVEKLNNFLVYCAHKTMPEAMEALVADGLPIDGYLGPGHVCSITGSKLFDRLVARYSIPLVISGFEAVDLLQSVFLLTQMILQNESGIQIQYRRLVSPDGNRKAQSILNEVFEPCTATWRGLGAIPHSGLKIRNTYAQWDAEVMLPVSVHSLPDPKGCLCGEILKGIRKPTECAHFGKKCTPEHPVGACMVSSEGTCQAYYSYQQTE